LMNGAMSMKSIYRFCWNFILILQDKTDQLR